MISDRELFGLRSGRRPLYDELIYCNTVACEPPLNKGEIRTICNSVTRYKR